ncbi:MAG: Trk system potassium transporter TrkA [Acidobacteria bacterium]|nr:Trk system potassium transporter TrkA [Acidobacteriota bacterium]
MKFVIVGAGSVGFQVATQLIAEEKDVVLIEKNPDIAKYAMNRLDCLVINAEGNNIDVLDQAGIQDADFFLSITDSDEVNMIACGLVASEYNVPYKIARVRNLDYTDSRLLQKSFLGIDYFVNPEVEAAKVIASTVEEGAYSEVLLFEKADLQMRKLAVSDYGLFKYKPLKKIKSKLKGNFLVAGIFREDQVIIPSGDTIIRPEDTLQIVASRKTLEDLFAKVGRNIKTKIENVVIVGGGRIGVYVTRLIYNKDRRIKIIDVDYKRCKVLSEMFPDVLVINSDITDESIYEEEQLSACDLIITTTHNQELNMLAAIYGKSLGIKQAIALVQNTNYMRLASPMGIDATVSPKSSAVDSILKFVRRGKIKSVHTLFGGKAQVIEFVIEAASPLAGTAIRNIRMPKSSLILSVIRDGESFVPGGDFVIHERDTIIVISTLKSLAQVEDLFTGQP